MVNKELSYFIERTEGEGFNLWAKKEDKYYNIATLFYNEEFCENYWSISNLEKSVFYSETEIAEELETPLIRIPNKNAEELLLMSTNKPIEILDYIKRNINHQSNNQ